MKVLLWNSYKADGATTYKALLDYEHDALGKVSTQITLPNMTVLKDVLDLVHNETDVDLCYAIEGMGSDL
tara:strand:- start:7 stop:216 length:210 start_codon:yes stop_codon:yes gene_type:complete